MSRHVVESPLLNNNIFLSFCLNTKRNKKVKSQICFRPHAGPPPHLAQATAPARYSVCMLSALRKKHQLFFQLLVPITIGKQPNFIRKKSDTVFVLVMACADKIQFARLPKAAAGRSKSVPRSAGWSFKHVEDSTRKTGYRFSYTDHTSSSLLKYLLASFITFGASTNPDTIVGIAINA